jgi:hypothetical protein
METVRNQDIVVIKSCTSRYFKYQSLIGTVAMCTYNEEDDALPSGNVHRKVAILEHNRWGMNFSLVDLRPATQEEIDAYNKAEGPINISEVDYTPTIQKLDEALNQLEDKLKGGKDV